MYSGRKIILKFARLVPAALFFNVLLIFFSYSSHAQISKRQNKADIKNNEAVIKDTLPSIIDSANFIPNNIDSFITDSLEKDSLQKASIENKLGIRISQESLSAVVNSSATDSAVIDMDKKMFYLYGDAKIDYEDMKLNAGKVSYDQTTNTVTAIPSFDTVGEKDKLPEFSQGQEKFTYDTLKYNFKSKRAIVRNARAQHGEGYVYSEQVKRNPDQSIYGWQNVYTTCALDTPHFGIRARRIKIIPNRVIASGAANLMVQQVPTPLYLPFGLFPISSKQRSGFVLPTYTVEEARGLGLVNGGYYFYLNDYVDALIQANIFTKGSYAVSGISTYSNRYKYNGGLSVSYASNKTGESYEPGSSQQKDFRLQWRHQTDAKAKPGVNFSASVDMGSNSFYSNNSYNPNQILRNNYLSTISYAKSWVGKPYSLTVNASYNQNTATNQTILRLPELNFYIAQFNPLQKKNRVGLPKWYEKITASYSFSALNETTFYDSSFNLNHISFNDFRNGFKHSIPISASYNVLRYINLSFSVPYTEYWFTSNNYRYYNVFKDKVDTITNRGFYTARDMNASVNMSTRIYGQKMFKKGKIMGIRHVLTPNIGFSYTPDFAARPFGYYYKTHLDGTNTPVYISPYEGSVIGTPGFGQYGDFASNINFGINNNLQLKTRSPKDTTGAGRNITLIDGFSINSAYNIAADSFNWQMINMDFRTTITDKLSISGSATFDPYDYDYENRRRSTTTAYANGNGIARFMGANISLSSSLRSTSFQPNTQLPNETGEMQQLRQRVGYGDYVDFNVPWNINLSYTLRIDKQPSQFRPEDTLVITQNAMFGGDVNITERWKLAISSGYNFTTKQLQFTSIDLYRDLHCFEMHLQAFPFGPRKSYNFTLNAKASILQDMRLLRRRDYRDTVF